jgi:hypothetical protein
MGPVLAAKLGHVQDSVTMCQDLGKCIGQRGLILLIKDSSRADAETGQNL